MTLESDLQDFLSAARADCARAGAPQGGDGPRVCATVLDRALAGASAPTAPADHGLAVTRHLPQALAQAATGPFSQTAQALARVAPHLSWQRRSSSRPEDGPFHDGHANAMILGPGGAWPREDVWIGVSLMAPGVAYPEHSHPPEEAYLPLGPGSWWNSAMGWVDPKGAALVYNPPGIAHAMRAAPDAPLLALWFLPL